MLQRRGDLGFFQIYESHLDLDPAKKLARVEAGVTCDQLRNAAEHHGLTLAPDPATHTARWVERSATTPAATPRMRRIWSVSEGGRRAEIYSKLLDLRDRYAEQIHAKYLQIPRRVSGYKLDELLAERGLRVARSLVGSESTCALVLSATVRLVPRPPIAFCWSSPIRMFL